MTCQPFTVGIGVEHLLHLLDDQRPCVVGHAARRVDDEDDVLAVHRQAADRRVVLAAVLRAEQPLHLLGQVLLRGDELALDVVRHLGVLARGFELPADRAQVATQPRNLQLLLRELDPARLELAVQHLAGAAYLDQFLLQLEHEPLQVLARLLDHHGLAHLGEHEQQDHRAEAAADRVEERQAEHLDVAPAEPRAPHGQSLAGLRNEPRVRRRASSRRTAPSDRLPSAAGSR